jgi:hypothetical protein
MSNITVGTPELSELLDQLAEGRHQLREEKATLKPKLAEADRLQREAKETRRRVRKAAARFLQRVRRKADAAAKPMAAARAELALQQEELARSFADLKAEREQFATDASAVRDQLRQSWELLAGQQEQLAAERHEREQELSRLFQLLDAREQDVTDREEKVKLDRQVADADLAALRAEITGLDQRVMSARLVLQELEQERAKQMVRRVTGDVLGFDDRVPLYSMPDVPSNELTALQIREDDLHREQKALAAGRQELEKLAEHLTDQRQVLAEQFQAFAAAKQAWQLAETHTVDELESLAKAVESREEMLAVRDAAADRLEDNRRERERELWKYQTTLDRWHATLTEREAQFLADRERSEVGLAARRGIVADREAGLDFVCMKWENEHERARDGLLEAMAKYHEERAACAAAAAECEAMRRQTQEQAAKLAAWLAAVEQQKAETVGSPDDKRAWRRVKVLRKRWEARFGRALRKLDDRLDRLHAESKAVAAKQADLHRLAADVSERQRQQMAADRAKERERVRAEKMPPDEPVILSIADARRQRSDAEMRRLKTAAELAADALLDADAKHDILRLKPAG